MKTKTETEEEKTWNMGHIALFGALLLREGIVGKEKEYLKKLMYKALTSENNNRYK